MRSSHFCPPPLVQATPPSPPQVRLSPCAIGAPFPSMPGAASLSSLAAAGVVLVAAQPMGDPCLHDAVVRAIAGNRRISPQQVCISPGMAGGSRSAWDVRLEFVLIEARGFPPRFHTGHGRSVPSLPSAEPRRHISRHPTPRSLQVLSRWSVQLGVPLLVHTTNLSHIADAADVFRFELSPSAFSAAAPPARTAQRARRISQACAPLRARAQLASYRFCATRLPTCTPPRIDPAPSVRVGEMEVLESVSLLYAGDCSPSATRAADVFHLRPTWPCLTPAPPPPAPPAHLARTLALLLGPPPPGVRGATMGLFAVVIGGVCSAFAPWELLGTVLCGAVSGAAIRAYTLLGSLFLASEEFYLGDEDLWTFEL